MKAASQRFVCHRQVALPSALLRAPRALPVRALRRARVLGSGLHVPAVSAETALTGITQNLYMPKTDAAEDELGFALQSNLYQIGYDQRGRITSFGRSAQATVGLPAMHETQTYTWDKNGNPSQITGVLKAMAVGLSSTNGTSNASTASNKGIAQTNAAATTLAAPTGTATTTANTSAAFSPKALPESLRTGRAGRKALGFQALPIPPSRLAALAARPPSPRRHAAGAFDLQGRPLIHSDKTSDYIYSAAQPDAGNYNAAGIDTSAATKAVSGAAAYANSASLGQGKGLQHLGLLSAPSAASGTRVSRILCKRGDC